MTPPSSPMRRRSAGGLCLKGRFHQRSPPHRTRGTSEKNPRRMSMMRALPSITRARPAQPPGARSAMRPALITEARHRPPPRISRRTIRFAISITRCRTMRSAACRPALRLRTNCRSKHMMRGGGRMARRAGRRHPLILTSARRTGRPLTPMRRCVRAETTAPFAQVRRAAPAALIQIDFLERNRSHRRGCKPLRRAGRTRRRGFRTRRRPILIRRREIAGRARRTPRKTAPGRDRNTRSRVRAAPTPRPRSRGRTR